MNLSDGYNNLGRNAPQLAFTSAVSRDHLSTVNNLVHLAEGEDVTVVLGEHRQIGRSRF